MKPSQPASLMSRLKQNSQPLHARLEKQPFFQALSDGSLPLAAYINQLRAFATAFGTLEHETANISTPAIGAVLDIGESRFQHLLRDLSCFGDQLTPDVIAAKLHADAMAAQIRRLGNEDPLALLGYVYALQGTMLGNRVHLADVQRILGRERPDGTAFYAGFGEKTDDYWAEFVSLMNSLSAAEEAAERILCAAREAFRFLEEIHAALFPYPAADQTAYTATSLNPEAGNHAVPADLREITAALAAGQLCRAEFPYFDARFGERGKRYTDSDVAWLATLPQLSAPLVIAQAAWLGGVLASRGMPRITLERQLYHLQTELSKAVGEKKNEYNKLCDAVSWLQAERLKQIPEDKFADLCAAFVAGTENELDGAMARTGSLLVSAVCDEKAGISAAVASLEAWLADPERFDAAWITAVHETIASARSAAR